jgi:hypothetical protein
MICATDDNRGVLRAALGEAIGGFAATRFPVEDRPRIAVYLERIDEPESLNLADEDLRFLVRVLQFALKELGPEEFSTITGYEFDFGVATLEHLQQEIASNNR